MAFPDAEAGRATALVLAFEAAGAPPTYFPRLGVVMESAKTRLVGRLEELPRGEEKKALLDEVAVAVLELKDEVLAAISRGLTDESGVVRIQATRAWIAMLEYLRRERRDRVLVGDGARDDNRVEISISISDQTEVGVRAADSRRVLEAGPRMDVAMLDRLRLDVRDGG